MATMEAAVLTVEETQQIERDRQTLERELLVARLAGLQDTELYKLKRGWLVGYQRALDANREAMQEIGKRNNEVAARAAAAETLRKARWEEAVKAAEQLLDGDGLLGFNPIPESEVLAAVEKAGIDRSAFFAAARNPSRAVRLYRRYETGTRLSTEVYWGRQNPFLAGFAPAGSLASA